ncbi:hypothetical protein MK904_03660 [Loigolactobacillus coryniformis]|uniref:Uncharacterized protein n=1 Tax=Loigolactobacillus coryniformis subsp. coryniformis KCTC 3167 = DSM 20001 TaxID=913848 RepID=A0A0R1FDK9_9LACO|nr:hypothetical protein [Loigolactobacillus coryniformis]KRK16919.1 hypothetical protein FD22_GL001044 [Loigolactobacillus coryniformis subsp. coryniformis KCTC 3167 = DSM 20001]MDC4185198.1 hypothetical protein [Loigolactobacillus coryniformis]
MDSWLYQTVQQLAQDSAAYEERAFFQALSQLALEQEKRIAQAQGEIDGRSWDEKSW